MRQKSRPEKLGRRKTRSGTFGARRVDICTAEEKIRVVLEGLRSEEESIAELCRREGIASSMILWLVEEVP